jgi:hypothetical protein
MAGLLTFPILNTFPSFDYLNSGVQLRTIMSISRHRDYSSGNCCRFARHSLLILWVIIPFGTITLQRYRKRLGLILLGWIFLIAKKLLRQSCLLVGSQILYIAAHGFTNYEDVLLKRFLVLLRFTTNDRFSHVIANHEVLDEVKPLYFKG